MLAARSLSRFRAYPSSLFIRYAHTRRSPSTKRILGAIAHINSGKTTTSEAMLYTSGALRRMGNVDSGDTAMDYLPAERARGITINAAAIAFDWQDHQVFLVDSPGHLDFTFEVERALRVMDGVVVLLDAVAGVQPQTETVWRQADSNGLPRLVFVNKMDREGADMNKTLDSVNKYFDTTPLPLQIPVFKEGSFVGVYNVLSKFDSDNVLSRPTAESDSIAFEALSEAERKTADSTAEALVEAIAEHDDDIMSLWLDGAHISSDQLNAAIRKACLAGMVTPVLCGASLRGLGVTPLLNSIIAYLPSPLERAPVAAKSLDGADVTLRCEEDSPFVAYAFKITHDKHRGRMVHLRVLAGELQNAKISFLNTGSGKTEIPTKVLRVLADKFEEVEYIGTGDIFATVGLKHTRTGDTLVLRGAPKSSQVILDGVRAPPAVFSIALEVDSSSQEKELDEALRRLLDEDSSLELHQDQDTGETLLSGMGELHLEVAIDNLERKLPFSVHRSKPRVSYRETVTGSLDRVESFNSAIGSTRMKASLRIKIDPADEPYSNEILVDDRAFSADEQEAVRNGIEAGLGRGPLMSASVTGVRVIASPGDDVGGNDVAGLRACASRGVQNSLRAAGMALLEPVMRVEAVIPDPHVGEIVSELTHPTKRRGSVESVESDPRFTERETGRVTNIVAIVPLEGMVGWSTKMRSITKGRGDLQMRFEEYRPVDAATRTRIITQSSMFPSP